MPTSPIFHGAKAKVKLDHKVVGIFTSCTWSYANDLHIAYVLGRTGPAAATYTGREAVNLTLTGFKVIGAGAQTVHSAPQLKDLLSYPGVQIEILERGDSKTGDQTVMRCDEFFANNISSGVNARTISDITVTGQALSIADDIDDGSEPANDVKIDDGT